MSNLANTGLTWEELLNEQKEVDCIFQHGGVDRKVGLVLNPSALTPERQAEINEKAKPLRDIQKRVDRGEITEEEAAELIGDRDDTSLYDVILLVVTDWDITMSATNRTKVPLTVEMLRKAPYKFLLAMSKIITSEIRPNRDTAAS